MGVRNFWLKFRVKKYVTLRYLSQANLLKAKQKPVSNAIFDVSIGLIILTVYRRSLCRRHQFHSLVVPDGRLSVAHHILAAISLCLLDLLLKHYALHIQIS